MGVQSAAVYETVRQLDEKGEEATAATVHEAFSSFLTINQVKNSLRRLEAFGYLKGEQPYALKMDNTKFYKVGADDGE